MKKHEQTSFSILCKLEQINGWLNKGVDSNEKTVIKTENARK